MAGKSGKRDVKNTLSGTKHLTFFKHAHMKKYLKSKSGSARVSKDGTSALASVAQTVMGEIINESNKIALSENKRKINPRHIFIAIHDDDDFKKVFKNVVVQGGGKGTLPPSMDALKKEFVSRSKTSK